MPAINMNESYTKWVIFVWWIKILDDVKEHAFDKDYSILYGIYCYVLLYFAVEQ